MTLAVPNVEFIPVTFDADTQQIVVPASHAPWVRIAYECSKKAALATHRPVVEPERFKDGSVGIKLEVGHLEAAVGGLRSIWHAVRIDSGQTDASRAETIRALGVTIGNVALEQMRISDNEFVSAAAIHTQMAFLYPQSQVVPRIADAEPTL